MGVAIAHLVWIFGRFHQCLPGLRMILNQSLIIACSYHHYFRWVSLHMGRPCGQQIQLYMSQVRVKVAQKKLTYSLVVLWNLSFKTLSTISSFRWCLRGSWIYSLYNLGVWNSPNGWIQHLYSHKKNASVQLVEIQIKVKQALLKLQYRNPLTWLPSQGH